MLGPSVPLKSHDLVGQGICFEAILLAFLLSGVFLSHLIENLNMTRKSPRR